MADKACVQRLQKEFRALCKEPVPHIVARPSPSDILEWHFALEGSEDTPFAGGVYHGKLEFPPDYPFKPPAIFMFTPSGRFAPNKRICMSMSDFHPETWNPMWSVASILTGLLSFMTDTAPTTGSVSSSAEEKRRLASLSLAHNCQSATFRKMFPDYVDKYQASKQAKGQAAEPGGKLVAKGVNGGNGPPQKGNRSSSGKKPSLNMPMWLAAVLFAVLASVMALPFLTLDLHL